MRELLAPLRAPRILVASLVLALVLAACGDSESTDAVGTNDANGSTTTAMADDDTMDDDTMDDDTMDDSHDHGNVLEVPEGMAVPTVSVSTEPDSVSGTNLFIELENFTIAPRHASTEPMDGEGHLHLYIDGERVMRFYNTALQITGLEPGEHEITVEVSSNNHAAYAVDGEPIRATETIAAEASEHSHNDHEPIDVDAASAPTADLTIVEDPKSGWNLEVAMTNFTITPENVGGEHVEGEGHLHLYVDGERITRLYGEWWHLPALTEGMHEVTVEVSSNNHAAYAVDGEPISASAMIDVSAEKAMAAAGESMDHGDDSMDHDDSMEDGDAMAPMEDGVLIEASFEGGTVQTDSDRVEVDRGSRVTIRIESDRAEEVHVHGYDLYLDVDSAMPGEMAFMADIPGIFEVELERAGTVLFELAVS